MEPEVSTTTPKVRAHISSGGFIQIGRGISGVVPGGDLG